MPVKGDITNILMTITVHQNTQARKIGLVRSKISITAVILKFQFLVIAPNHSKSRNKLERY